MKLMHTFNRILLRNEGKNQWTFEYSQHRIPFRLNGNITACLFQRTHPKYKTINWVGEDSIDFLPDTRDIQGCYRWLLKGLSFRYQGNNDIIWFIFNGLTFRKQLYWYQINGYPMEIHFKTMVSIIPVVLVDIQLRTNRQIVFIDIYEI